MLLLSLGPEAIVRLLQTGEGRVFAGPDLSWLLFGPDGEAVKRLAETVPNSNQDRSGPENFHEPLQAAE